MAFANSAVPVPLAGTTPRRFVLGVAALVVVLRLGYLVGPLFSDEAGYLLVAQDWHAGGPNLYGHYFVDRPPLLMALYRVAVLTGWPPTVRLLATLFAVVLVVSAGWAAHQVVGERGARWAALVAAAFAVTPLVMSQEADGEIFAAPLVMLSIALTLAAVRRAGGRAFGLAVLPGVVAGAAVMVKQNFADAVVFAVVLLVASLVQRRTPVPVVARVAAGGVLGGLGVVAGALAYVAWSGVGLGTAWSAVFGFRGTALDVITDHSLHAPMLRALEMTVLAVLCGALPLLVVLALEGFRCRFRGPPVAWAVGATLLLDVVSITGGWELLAALPPAAGPGPVARRRALGRRLLPGPGRGRPHRRLGGGGHRRGHAERCGVPAHGGARRGVRATVRAPWRHHDRLVRQGRRAAGRRAALALRASLDAADAHPRPAPGGPAGRPARAVRADLGGLLG